ncbi:bifunctional folylpolyglutamate synthase/dihydrofolate synthase [Sphingomonas xanthus]|uniref:Dihydrofolate synthase/folylpolyglutamate synthase n=1 Tax=Sphingomonas xanthus TaxID=2594473 RepID=A0A516ISY7_9SPHN|nr:folylpolyglutamate synthase/dihydrofolate synthase family protein [Sphingomonas xanthus]QDP20042.1 bifunctional folylpolyglutamate synthase/dihydrofolate synthase [Sphingomonas xanthus]
MKEVVRSSDPRIAALIARQAAQSADGDQIGLGRIRALLDRLGRPQDSLPPVLHVAGTNGKGSTCAFLRAALEAAGKRVHVFTSPHLVRYNERIRIAGTLIDDVELGGRMAAVLDANEEIGASLFEVNVAVAFLAFRDTPADACILEVGLGGRLDATNVIERPLVCGIASLGLDHQQFLGRNMVGVAREKAGIAKPAVPLVTQLYPPDIAAAVAGIAGSVGAPVEARGSSWTASLRHGAINYRDREGMLKLPTPRLAGKHQAMNAALAVAMLRHQSTIAVPPPALTAAMGWAQWPARLQQLTAGPMFDMLPRGSELWVDGGHNPAAARLIADHARRHWQDGKRLVLVFASLASKDAAGTLRPFRGLAQEVLTLGIDGHDCRSPEALEQLAETMGCTARAKVGLADAMAALRQPARVLVFGSLYLAGELLTLNGPLPE